MTKIFIVISAFILIANAKAEQLAPNTERFLKNLVETNSGTENETGQQAVRELIKQEFAQYGLVANEIDLPDIFGANNGARKILVFKTPDSSEEIVLLGHTDTVFPPTLPAQPFAIKDGKISAPGVIDMKGGIALIGDILGKLTEGERQRIQVIFNDDEETGSGASREKLRELTRSAKAILIFEPGLPDGAVVGSHGGAAAFSLQVKGKAAHAGLEPQKGFSACTELSYKIAQAVKLNDRANSINVNPGVIQGGTKRNIVCEHARVELDTRFKTLAQFDNLEKSLHHITDTNFSQTIPADFSPSATLTPVYFLSPFVKQRSANLFSIFSKAAHQLSIPAKEQYVGYATDASSVITNPGEILVGLGPYGGGMHTSEEFLSVKSYDERLKLDTAFIKALLKEYAHSR